MHENIDSSNFLPCGKLRGLCTAGVGPQDKQLNTYDYLADVPGNNDTTDLVEVQFKNTRKAYFHNSNKLQLVKGDLVAVEASPGHDVGTVTLTGQLVPLQMKKAGLKAGTEIKTNLPQGARGGHGKVSRGKGTRARNNDSLASNSQRTWFTNEDWRCGIPR